MQKSPQSRQMSPQKVALLEETLPQSYTLSQVASHLGVREDDLMALLPDTAIVVNGQSGPYLRFTPTDVELLEQLIRTIRKFYAESVYGGGDL